MSCDSCSGLYWIQKWIILFTVEDRLFVVACCTKQLWRKIKVSSSSLSCVVYHSHLVFILNGDFYLYPGDNLTFDEVFRVAYSSDGFFFFKWVMNFLSCLFHHLFWHCVYPWRRLMKRGPLTSFCTQFKHDLGTSFESPIPLGELGLSRSSTSVSHDNAK